VAKASETIEKKVLSEYVTGRLVETIFDLKHVAKPNDDPLLRACVRLHNRGRIDLLSLPQLASFQAVSGHRFFKGQRFYTRTIPLLKGSVEKMMQCIDSLVRQAGADGAAGSPNKAFQDWCKRDPKRARKVIKMARANKALAKSLLVFALIGANAIKDAQSLARKYNDVRRLHAVMALGKMRYSSRQNAQTTLGYLEALATNQIDDDLRGRILEAIVAIAHRHHMLSSSQVLGLLSVICTSPGPLTLFFCADTLRDHSKVLVPDAVAPLLKALESVDPSHKGTIDELDQGLAAMLDTEHASRAIEFVEKILTARADGPKLSSFPDFGSRLLSGLPQQFCTTFISWMMTGQHALCDGLAKLFQASRRDKHPIELDIGNQTLADSQKIYFSRKVLGYFFLQPLVATSILISVIRHSNKEVTGALEGLLVDQVLANYGGNVIKYLRKLPKDDRASPAVRRILKRNANYLRSLALVSPVKELHPSLYQTEVERFRINREMDVARKNAEKKSVFLSVIRRSVLLYGRGSISYVESHEGERKPVAIDLKTFSVEFEMPRLQMIDPVGLELAIRVFRFEGPTP
jgi:hypothetical protein